MFKERHRHCSLLSSVPPGFPPPPRIPQVIRSRCPENEVPRREQVCVSSVSLSSLLTQPHKHPSPPESPTSPPQHLHPSLHPLFFPLYAFFTSLPSSQASVRPPVARFSALRRGTHQEAIDVRLRDELLAVLGRHAAAVPRHVPLPAAPSERASRRRCVREPKAGRTDTFRTRSEEEDPKRRRIQRARRFRTRGPCLFWGGRRKA